MGQARNRGTRDERVAQAISEGREKGRRTTWAESRIGYVPPGTVTLPEHQVTSRRVGPDGQVYQSTRVVGRRYVPAMSLALAALMMVANSK